MKNYSDVSGGNISGSASVDAPKESLKKLKSIMGQKIRGQFRSGQFSTDLDLDLQSPIRNAKSPQGTQVINRESFNMLGGTEEKAIINQDYNTSYYSSKFVNGDKEYVAPDILLQKKFSLKKEAITPEFTKEQKQFLEGIIKVMRPQQKLGNFELTGVTNQEKDCRYQKKFGIIPKVYQVEKMCNGLKKALKLDEKLQEQFKDQNLSMSIGSCDNERHVHDSHTCDFLDPSKIVISHTGIYYRVWSSFINYLCLVSSFIYAHFAAFKHESHENDKITSFIEFMFFCDLIIHFIKDFQDPLKPMGLPIRDHEKIANEYLKGGFKLDFVTLIPFWCLNLRKQRERYFHAIKLLRMKRGLSNLDIDRILKWYKVNQQKELEQLIQDDPQAANCKDVDQTKIGNILAMSFFIKIMKIMIFVSSCCYFFAMIFQLLLEVQSDIYNWDEFREPGANPEDEPEHFVSFYGLEYDEESDFRKLLVLIYFSFTSLSTVGFGDYNPRSDAERIFIAFGLMFGVAIFSYIMGQFIQIVESFSSYNQVCEEGDELSRFFGVLMHFNNYDEFNLELKRKIECYFDYRWDQDKYQVINSTKDQNFLEQCPQAVQDDLLCKFLFQVFLYAYNSSFDFPKQSKFQHSRYTWADQNYRQFMSDILHNLEPIKYDKQTILFDELDEFASVIYIVNSYFHVGYSINKQHYFKLKLKNQDIGAYGVTFNEKSNFIFKTGNECQAFFIRKKNWFKIIQNDDSKDTVELLKDHLKNKYENILKTYMTNLKEQDLKTIKSRSGLNGIIHLTLNNDENKGDTSSLYVSKRVSQPLLSYEIGSEQRTTFREQLASYRCPSVVEESGHKSDDLPLDKVIEKNQEKVEEYEDLLDEILCNMFVQQLKMKQNHEKLQQDYESVQQKQSEVEDECIALKLDIKKNRKILGHTQNELNSTKAELEEYKMKYEQLLQK